MSRAQRNRVQQGVKRLEGRGERHDVSRVLRELVTKGGEDLPDCIVTRRPKLSVRPKGRGGEDNEDVA